MNFQFTCDICAKQVKRGEKFSIETDKHECSITKSGEFIADTVCRSCHTKVIRYMHNLAERAGAAA